MSTGRMKKSERRKVQSLPSKQVKQVREKQQANRDILRKRWRQKQRQRGLWGKNEYSDDDFISRLLVKWPFGQLLEYSKLLVLLLNRRSITPNEKDMILPPPKVSTLVYFKYPSEYYDTIFSTYTRLIRDERSLSFYAYYTEIYKEAAEHASHPMAIKQLPSVTRHHAAMLKACFMVALTYDARIRRFVFTRHDIHYNYMKTHPPSVAKTSQFIEEMQPFVNRFIEYTLGGEELAIHAIDLWRTQYMFRLD